MLFSRVTQDEIADWLDERGEFAPGWEVVDDLVLQKEISGAHLNSIESLYAGASLSVGVSAIILAATIKEPVTITLLLMFCLAGALLYKVENRRKIAAIQADNDAQLRTHQIAMNKRHDKAVLNQRLSVSFELIKIKAHEVAENASDARSGPYKIIQMLRIFSRLKRGELSRLDDEQTTWLTRLLKTSLERDVIASIATIEALIKR